MTVQFAPEKEKQVKTLTAVKESLSTEFALDSASVSLTDLGMTKDYHLTSGVQEYELTQRAFKGLLRELHIPYRFGMSIPEDLLDHIVHRLRVVKPHEVQLFTQDQTVYGLASAGYKPPDLLNIIEILGDRKLEMARVGTDGIRLATVTEANKVEVKKGDIIKAGIYLSGSHTGKPMPAARLMTYRLVCSNGAVAGKSWGDVSWPRRNGGSFDMFSAGLRGLMGEEKRLIPVIGGLATRNLTDSEFSRLWKQTRKVTGVETADKLLDVEPDNRKAIVASALVKHKSGEDPEELADFLAYDAFNRISQFANDLPGAQAERMMRVAGLLLRGE